MAKLILALVCQRPLLDQPSNLVSYIDVLDGLDVARFPFKMPPVFLASIWQREEESSLEVRVEVHSPKKEKVAEATAGPLVFSHNIRRARVHCRVPSFDASVAGVYQYRLSVKAEGKWKHVSDVSVDLAHKTEPSKTSVAPAKREAAKVGRPVARKAR